MSSQLSPSKYHLKSIDCILHPNCSFGNKCSLCFDCYIRGLQSELYLPFGPKDIPRRIPCLGIEMKYIGHIATHRVSTPNMPTKDDSKLTFSLTLLWYFSFFYLQSQHILTVEFCTSWHIFPQTHFSVHEKTATNDELYLSDAMIFITLPEKWWQMQLQW